jgi:glycine cleavage system H lipoate-binding protein
MMPDMNGFELMDELEYKRIETPVIIMTGFSTLETAVKAIKRGAVNFIPKPFTAEEIIGCIYSGIEYYKIKLALKSQSYTESASSIIYVPCPSKYSQFGVLSWINKDVEGVVYIGITDLYLKTISSIKEIKFKEVDGLIKQGINCADIISTDNYTHQLISPLSGSIIDINTEIINDVSLLEKDPYFKGWLYRIIPSDIERELKNLIPCGTESI